MQFLSVFPLLAASDADLVFKINEYRIEMGVPGLYNEDNLNITAEKYALELQAEKRISHVDLHGNRVLDRYRDNGGTAVIAGEILGTSNDPAQIYRAWMESESHNRLMLDPKWNRIGGAVLEENGVYVAVILFSNSLIEDYFYIKDGEDMRMMIQSIHSKFRLIFPENLTCNEMTDISGDKREYELVIKGEDLPLILSVSGDYKGVKKISDFLYIQDIKLSETH